MSVARTPASCSIASATDSRVGTKKMSGGRAGSWGVVRTGAPRAASINAAQAQTRARQDGARRTRTARSPVAEPEERAAADEPVLHTDLLPFLAAARVVAHGHLDDPVS